MMGFSAMRRFIKDRKGVSAVEFALIAPVLVALYLGSAEMTMALNADRKVTAAANAIADLVAQDDFLTDDELDDIYSAGDAVLFPNDASILAVRITSIVMESDGDVIIDWSEARGTNARAANEVPTLPDGLLAPLNSVVMVEVTYPFFGPFHQSSGPLLTLTDTAYLRPRRSPWVRRER